MQGRVCVIDDDQSFRKALERRLLREGLEVSSFETAEDFLADKDEVTSARCILLDLCMPGMDGLQLQKKLIDAGVTGRIVFLSGHGTIPDTVQAMKEGAFDFLTKPVDWTKLLHIITEAMTVADTLRQKQLSKEQTELCYESLSERERQVFGRVVAGAMNKEVAAELDISVATVKVHRFRAMKKMQADSFADLVRMAESLQKTGIELQAE